MYHSTLKCSCHGSGHSSNYIIAEQGSTGVRDEESSHGTTTMQCDHCKGRGTWGAHRQDCTGWLRTEQESSIWAWSVGCYSEGSVTPQDDFKR